MPEFDLIVKHFYQLFAQLSPAELELSYQKEVEKLKELMPTEEQQDKSNGE